MHTTISNPAEETGAQFNDNLSLPGHLTLARKHPHDFTLQYPPRREYFQDNFRAAVDPTGGATQLIETLPGNELLVYLHVPFCQAKCFYCNFAVDIRKDKAIYNRYVSELVKSIAELEAALPANVSIPGIDIGGGTPTMLESEQLVTILTALKPLLARSAATARPLSIETTPSIAAEQKDKLSALRENGVDRISVGLQSTNNETLASVNRGRQIDLADQAIANIKDSRFERISVDLIFALPGQTEQMWLTDLQLAADMGVDTITTYDCLYRGKGRALTRRTNDKPDTETYGRLYDLAFNYLTGRGYHAPYGSVNFSRHQGETGTSSYFEGRLLDGLPYVGLGNYASSLIGQNWWFAPYGVNQWLSARASGIMLPVGDAYHLPVMEIMAKHVLANLSFGVIDGQRFRRAFSMSLEDSFGPSLEMACEHGWLTRDSGNSGESDNHYSVAPSAFKHMSEIRALFYTPAAIAWLGKHE